MSNVIFRHIIVLVRLIQLRTYFLKLENAAIRIYGPHHDSVLMASKSILLLQSSTVFSNISVEGIFFSLCCLRRKFWTGFRQLFEATLRKDSSLKLLGVVYLSVPILHLLAKLCIKNRFHYFNKAKRLYSTCNRHDVLNLCKCESSCTECCTVSSKP